MARGEIGGDEGGSESGFPGEGSADDPVNGGDEVLVGCAVVESGGGS